MDLLVRNIWLGNNTYTFTNNESHFAGVSVATGYQLSPK